MTNKNDLIRRGDAIAILSAASRTAQKTIDAMAALPAALATPAPDAVQEAAIDIAAIENGGKRWHGEDHRVVAVRWEPYKPDGQRQMKAKGRWQEQVGSGDYWRWQNCDRPAALRAALAAALAASPPADPVTNAGCRQPVKVKPLEWVEFADRAAKAQAWNEANYMIQKWSDQWELSASYPGYSASICGIDRFHGTIEAAKAAAQSDYEARILAALEPAPRVNETPKSEHDSADVLTAMPAAVTPADAMKVPEVQDEQFTDYIEVALDPVGAWNLITALRAALAAIEPASMTPTEAAKVQALVEAAKSTVLIYKEAKDFGALRATKFTTSLHLSMSELEGQLDAALAALEVAPRVNETLKIEHDSVGVLTAAAVKTPEELARLFHETYESLAHRHGYETRADTRQFDPASPNGRLMIDTCGRILDALEPAPVTLAEAARIVREAINKGHKPFRLATNAAFREINCDGLVASVSRIAIVLEAAMRAIEEGDG